MNIKFTNGTNFEYLNALETSTFYDNANRRMLEISMAKDIITLDELNTILSDSANTTQIHLTNEELGIENIYDNYEIKMELAVKPVENGIDENGETIKEERIVFKLGKLTTIEKQLKALGVRV